MKKLILFILMLAMVALCAANLWWGSLDIPAEAVWKILCGEDVPEHPSWKFIILENRIPQMVTALCCGAALSTSGLLLQTAFRNPLAGPSILGIDSGANLGVALAMLYLGGSVTLGSLSLDGYLLVIAAAMAGALGIMGLLLLISGLLRSPVMLLITGVIISYVTGALISLLNFSATEEGVHSYIMWGMGNFGGVTLKQLPFFSTVSLIGIGIAILMIKPLNALLLGEHYAQNLGINIMRTRTMLLISTGILVATTTAFCGPISFIGLAVPHLARLILGTNNHKSLMPVTILMGITIALLCNLISALPGDKGLIPLNAITPFIGAPVILYVLLRGNNR